MILCTCAGWCESVHFAQAQRHFLAWHGPGVLVQHDSLLLTLKAPSKICSRRHSNFFFYFYFFFSEKPSLDISCESSTWQMIHMKCQDLFSLKNNKKKCHLLQLWRALRVNLLNLTLKAPSRIVADDILIFLLYFRKNKTWHLWQFRWNVKHYFLWKHKENKNIICRFDWQFNTYHAMGRFSRRQTNDIFLFFLENRIWHFMQIVSLGDSLLEVVNPI